MNEQLQRIREAYDAQLATFDAIRDTGDCVLEGGEVNRVLREVWEWEQRVISEATAAAQRVIGEAA